MPSALKTALPLSLIVALAACAGFQTGPLSNDPPENLDEPAKVAEQSDEDDGANVVRLVIIPTDAAELMLEIPNEEPEDEAIADEMIDLLDEDEFEDDGEEDATRAADLWLGSFGNSERRLFLHFDLSTIPANAQIDAASVVLSSSDDLDGEFQVVYGAVGSAWASKDMTWDTQPPLVDDMAEIADIDDDEYMDAFDLLETVRKWRSGEVPNHGVAFKPIPENIDTYKSYRSLESGNILAGPRLEITYRTGP